MSKDRSKIAKQNKRKGKYFEDKIVKILRQHFPQYSSNEFSRTPFSKTFTPMNQKGDLILPEGFFTDYIECKYRLEIHWDNDIVFGLNGEPLKWVQRCIEDCDSNKWMLVFQAKGKSMYCITPLKINVKKFEIMLDKHKLFCYNFEEAVKIISKKEG